MRRCKSSPGDSQVRPELKAVHVAPRRSVPAAADSQESSGSQSGVLDCSSSQGLHRNGNDRLYSQSDSADLGRGLLSACEQALRASQRHTEA